jgi:hypothetical protein
MASVVWNREEGLVITRYTVTSEMLEGMIATVMKDTEELIGSPGEEGVRARAVRALYPALMRWLADEMDMQTKPSEVALAYGDCGAILCSTILYNVTDSAKIKQAMDYMFDHMKSLTKTLISKSSHFEKMDLEPAGEG